MLIKLLRIFLLILPLFLMIPTVAYFLDNSIVLFPNPAYTNQIEPSTTHNSSIEEFRIDPERITFSYILREESGSLPLPFSSIVIWLKRENKYFDLSGYDYLFLEIEKATEAKVVVFIKTFENGVSKPEKYEGHTLRHNEYTLSFVDDVFRYKINIKDFFTPEWWFNMMNVPWDKRVKEEYKKVSALDFQFIHRNTNQLEEKKESFIIKKITFHKSYPVLFIILNIVTALYCIFLATGIFTKSNLIKGPVKEYIKAPLKEIQYRQLELKNYACNELTRIIKYLEQHYPNPRISATLISRETGIPRSHISEQIKNQYNCSCKKLINRIRITEAKRLLKATDLRILEIALEVGFNDISTFNRCFKEEEGLSPRQYRSNLQV